MKDDGILRNSRGQRLATKQDVWLALCVAPMLALVGGAALLALL